MQGYRGILFAAPCGAGKGSIIAYIMASAALKGHRVLMLAHRTDLVAGPNAIGDRLEHQMKFPKKHIGYLMPAANFKKYGIPKSQGPNRQIVMGTVQTASKRKIGKFDILIVDETHRIRTGSYEKVLSQMLQVNPNLVVMGFTATPERLDGKPLGKIFQKIVQVASHGQMVKDKYLVPCTYRYPVTVDVSKVRTRMGEYVESDLEEVYTDEVLNSIIDKWQELAPARKTIVFTINRKQQARVMADLFRRRGVKAEAIVSDTEDRSELLEKFQRNEFQVLVNVNLFTEGLSIDDVDCILLAYATKSIVKYVQSASRGARPVWNADYSDWATGPDGEYIKPDCLVIDCGGNILQFGKLEQYGADGFELKETERKKRKGEAPLKRCDECFAVVPASSRTCPECGYAFPIGEDDGVLATDADWTLDDPYLPFIRKFHKDRYPYRRMIQGLASRKRPELILPIQAINGYTEEWAARVAVEVGYKKRLNPDDPTDRESIIRYLRSKTKQAGYWQTYKNIIEHERTLP